MYFCYRRNMPTTNDAKEMRDVLELNFSAGGIYAGVYSRDDMTKIREAIEKPEKHPNFFEHVKYASDITGCPLDEVVGYLRQCIQSKKVLSYEEGTSIARFFPALKDCTKIRHDELQRKFDERMNSAELNVP